MVSLDALRRICQKPEKLAVDRWMGRHVYRQLSIICTWGFVNAGVSANSVSLCGNLLCVAGVLLYGFGEGIVQLLLGVVLLQSGILMDYSDGEVARYWRSVEVVGGREAKRGLPGLYVDNVGEVLLHPLAMFCFGYHLAGRVAAWQHAAVLLGIVASIAASGATTLLRDYLLLYVMRRDAPVASVALGRERPGERADRPAAKPGVLRRVLARAEMCPMGLGSIISAALLIECCLRGAGQPGPGTLAAGAVFLSLTTLYVARCAMSIRASLALFEEYDGIAA